MIFYRYEALMAVKMYYVFCFYIVFVWISCFTGLARSTTRMTMPIGSCSRRGGR